MAPRIGPADVLIKTEIVKCLARKDESWRKVSPKPLSFRTKVSKVPPFSNKNPGYEPEIIPTHLQSIQLRLSSTVMGGFTVF